MDCLEILIRKQYFIFSSVFSVFFYMMMWFFFFFSLLTYNWLQFERILFGIFVSIFMKNIDLQLSFGPRSRCYNKASSFGWLIKNLKYISHSSRAWKSGIRASLWSGYGRVLARPSLLDCEPLTSCIHTWQKEWRDRASACVFSCKGSNPIHEGS